MNKPMIYGVCCKCGKEITDIMRDYYYSVRLCKDFCRKHGDEWLEMVNRHAQIEQAWLREIVKP